MTISLSKVLHALLAGLAAALLLGGCAIAQERPPAGATTDGTQVVLNISKDGKVEVSPGAGRRLQRCQLCNAELQARYGSNCEKASSISPPLCMITTNATVSAVEPVAILITNKNPTCATIFIAGSAYQVLPCW